MPRRSVLFSPGDQADLLRKAPESGADVVVFDLEDSVVPAQKDRARESVLDVLADRETLVADVSDPPEFCVRINPLSGVGSTDLAAIAGSETPPDSIMLPKVDSDDDVAALSRALDDVGERLPVLALLETAGGILNAPAIAAHPATDAVLFGAEDLSADIGATRTKTGDEVSYARQRTVIAASHASVDAIDTLHTDFEDMEGLADDVEVSVTLGFEGKMAIHPAQVPVINEGFAPEPDQVDWAQRVLAARDEADDAGRGVFAVDGEMIDAPLIKRAESILERAGERAGERPGR